MTPSEEYDAICNNAKVQELADKARELGLMFHIAGIPHGAPYAVHLKTLGFPEPEFAGEGSVG